MCGFWLWMAPIRELRGFDVTQGEFARRLGISQNQPSKCEREIAVPPADILIRIKQQFRVSIDWLLTREPENVGYTSRR